MSEHKIWFLMFVPPPVLITLSSLISRHVSFSVPIVSVWPTVFNRIVKIKATGQSVSGLASALELH